MTKEELKNLILESYKEVLKEDSRTISDELQETFDSICERITELDLKISDTELEQKFNIAQKYLNKIINIIETIK